MLVKIVIVVVVILVAWVVVTGFIKWLFPTPKGEKDRGQ